MPREQPRRNGFDPANWPPDRRSSMAPNCARITEGRRCDMMHHIILMKLVQAVDQISRRLLPEHVIKLCQSKLPFQFQKERIAIMKDKGGQGLLASNSIQPLL